MNLICVMALIVTSVCAFCPWSAFAAEVTASYSESVLGSAVGLIDHVYHPGPRGAHIVWVTSGDAGKIVWSDGIPSGPYDEVSKASVRFSGDGRHISFIAKPAGKQQVVVNGLAGPTYDSINTHSPFFSPDGSRTAYSASKGGLEVAVIDGIEQPAFKLVEGPVFSHSGKRDAYAARTMDGKEMAVIDGKRGPLCDAIGLGRIVFSTDDKHVAYTFRSNGKWRVQMDDGVGPEYDGIAVDFPVFSHSGRHTAYVAAQGDKQLIVADGVAEPLHQRVTLPQWTSDEKALIYTAVDEDKAAVIVNGIPGPKFDAINQVFVSPAGDRVSYIACTGNTQCVVTDGKSGPPHYRVGDDLVVWSADGQHVAYAVADKRSDQLRCCVVYDGVEEQQYDGIGTESIVICNDGPRLSYSARIGDKWRVVVDGVASAPYDKVAPAQFSPDGKHLAFVGVSGDRMMVVADNMEGPQFADISKPVLFTHDNAIHYAGRTVAEKWKIVSHGDTISEIDEFVTTVASPGSLHLVTHAVKNGKHILVADGNIFGGFEAIFGSPVFVDDRHIEVLGVHSGNVVRGRIDMGGSKGR